MNLIKSILRILMPGRYITKVPGVVIGIVTDNQDPEGLGRVKLRFPWNDESDENYWARIATTMAGTHRGTYFLPEVEDEVLVAFEGGDIHHPYIVGSLWNGQNLPPANNYNGQNNIRKITSRSGHEIIFDDNHHSQQEKLEIHTNSGHKIILDDSHGQEKIEIKDKSDQNSITIDSVQGLISITSRMQISIDSTNIELKSAGTMNICAGGTLRLEGAMVMIN